MEWFYNEPSNEPSVFEGDSRGSTSTPNARSADIFSSRSAVELEPRSECDTEPEYFGSSDEPEELLAPEEAFIKFFTRSTAAQPGADFSSAVYAEAATNDVPKHAPRRNPAGESRNERIARLTAELDSLETQTSINSAEAADPLEDLSTLRAQLKRIEEAANTPPSLLLRQRHPRKDIADEESANVRGGLTIQLVSPDVTAVSILEGRVSTLERSIGLTHKSEFCNGKAMADMLREIQGRVEFATDETLAERLKGDAREIAEVLQKELESQQGTGFVKSATVLEKMEKWERLADTVPVVVERLRCFKRLQEEAGHFVASLAALGRQVDSLAKRSEINGNLIANVSKNLEANCAAVQTNLDILESKLAKQIDKAG